MKNYLLLLMLTTSLGFAQIPTGYYNTATGNGYTLKTNLTSIIATNTNSLDVANYGDLWTLFTTTAFRDNYYENNGTLLDIYSENPSGADSYEYSSTFDQCGNYSGEGSCYNREHIMPQSVFGSNNYPMYSDAHFVLPSDGSVNGQRGNFPFGVVSSASWTSTNGSKKGGNINSGYAAGYSGTVFEPIDEFKGDVARALLYFATRYENEVTNWTYDMLNNTTNQVYTNTFLNILITWHTQDPVSAYEIAKNNAVYTFQNNRNPYIDHPEYVCQIWSTQCSVLSNQDFVSLDDILIYPNPSNDNTILIDTKVELTAILLINTKGQVVQKINKPLLNHNTYRLENIPTGFYFLKLNSANQFITKKIIIH
ncbi:endonuclease [uncultured Flavobacterium sp.]|uniref:endonuclease n=1 Tax=uncultured Flavobacterium sp. TaxID=165435 RepID=UPI0030CA3897|tara:strand:+ start:125 stop:1225 length:1101 start_codon:yes stop_codon:yes gene_type:complete